LVNDGPVTIVIDSQADMAQPEEEKVKASEE